MSAGLIIGLDLGTSGIKAIAVNYLGDIVARSQARYETRRPEAGASEQDPHEWIEAIRTVCKEIHSLTENAQWDVIGLSAMLPTLVTADRDGNPVGAAITWEDSRAFTEGEEFRKANGGEELYKLTGQWVDARYLLPMISRLRSVDPERIEKSALVLGAKDYIFSFLTSCFITDPSTASGFGCYDLANRQWDPGVLEKSENILKDLDLPEILPSTTTRPLSPTAAKYFGLPSGIPVCLGAADSVMGAVGMGVRAQGDIAYIGGTSTIILGVSDSLICDPEHRYLITPMIEKDAWGFEMDLLSTGSAIRWLSKLLNVKDEESLIESARLAKVSHVPTFLPYLAPGEQGALWDEDLRGTILDLDLGHTAADLAYALLEGIILESKRCIDVLSGAGFKDEAIKISGGSASNPWFRQQLANAVQRATQSHAEGEPDRSALGAALVAAQSIDIHIDISKISIEESAPNPFTADHWKLRQALSNEARRRVSGK